MWWVYRVYGRFFRRDHRDQIIGRRQERRQTVYVITEDLTRLNQVTEQSQITRKHYSCLVVERIDLHSISAGT